MDIRMGSQTFVGVTVPILWGTRAILQAEDGSLSIIELSGEQPRPEVIGDKPAPGTAYLPQASGFRILGSDNEVLYVYEPTQKRVTGVGLRLPEFEIRNHGIRIGSNSFHANVITGHPVGIAVTETSIALGTELPKGLTSLSVPSPRRDHTVPG